MPLTAAARVLPPIDKATVAPASFRPVMVVEPISKALITSSVATTLITGAMGASVSTLMAAVPMGLLLPAASVCTALKVAAPCPSKARSEAIRVKLQEVPTTVAARGVFSPMLSATLAPASLVPVILLPISKPLMVGATGAWVSTVMSRLPATLWLPAESVCTTLKVSGPSPMALMSEACSA